MGAFHFILPGDPVCIQTLNDTCSNDFLYGNIYFDFGILFGLGFTPFYDFVPNRVNCLCEQFFHVQKFD
jgi:hypothetical protein